MKVTKATFPSRQRLGQTSLMRIAVRNTGQNRVPAAAITVSLAGKEGRTSMLPFGIHDPQPGLAQPDRPVWVLAEGYPKPAGATTKRGGTVTASPKTFDFGALDPGKSVEGIWKLSAVRPGEYTVRYSVDANLTGSAKAKTGGGAAPGGSFRAKITTATPETEVTDSGEVVEIGGSKGSSGR